MREIRKTSYQRIYKVHTIHTNFVSFLFDFQANLGYFVGLKIFNFFNPLC